MIKEKNTMITVEGVEEFTCIEDAMQYIKGYCNKHTECVPKITTPCRLYDEGTGGCFLCNQVIPADWVIRQEDEDVDV